MIFSIFCSVLLLKAYLKCKCTIFCLWKQSNQFETFVSRIPQTPVSSLFCRRTQHLQGSCKGQLASLQTPECHSFLWIDKIICTHCFMPADGKRIEKMKKRVWGAFGLSPPSLFNQRRKTDMSNHNKTSAGKWAFAITVSQPPLERPPFLDINQSFMDWFLHSLFNYSYFFYLFNNWRLFVRLNHFFVGNHIFISCLCQLFFLSFI